MKKPSAGVGPVAFGGGEGDPEQFRACFQRAADEVAELDQFGLGRLLGREASQGLVKGKKVFRGGIGSWTDLVQVHALSVAAMLAASPTANSVNENTPHRLGRRSEEMPAPVPGLTRMTADQPQVGLVNQGSGIEGLPCSFAGNLLGGESAQFVIDKWQ